MNLFKRLDSHQTYIIAEMSANHGGSYERAIQLVHAAALAGADCLKIQTYTPDTITLNSRRPEFMIEGGLWDGMNLHDLYAKAMTPWEWHKGIKQECEKLGLDFLSTPFDRTSVDFLEDLGVGLYKIASTEIIDIPLIEYVASKHKPMIVSVGYADENEIADAVEAMRRGGCDTYILLRCSAEYPANPERMNLALIPDMAAKFECRVGLSDHTLTPLSSILAVGMGACVIEKHMCLSRDIPTPDSEFSTEFQDFVTLVKNIRLAEKAIGVPYYEGVINGGHQCRSLYAVKNIKAREKFTSKNVRSVRPGKGIHPKHLDFVLKKTAARDIEACTPLSWDLIGK